MGISVYMKLIKIKHKDENSIDSIVERKSRFGNETDKYLLSQAEAVWHSFREFRERRARVIRFVYEDQWGDYITVNGKTMTQREYLTKQGNVALQANLMASKANSIVGSHVKEGAIPSIHARARDFQVLGEILSETLHANWDNNDMSELKISLEQELLYGGLAVAKESFEKMHGEEDAWTRVVNPNMFAFSSAMQDSRFNDISMIVELHDYTFNEMCAAYVESDEDYEQLKEWYGSESSPLKADDLVDVSQKNDNDRTFFYNASNSKMCRVIEVWTKERRPRYHVWDPQEADTWDIDLDDKDTLNLIKRINKDRTEQGKALGFADDEIPTIQLHMFVDTFWYVRHLTPSGYILFESESNLPDREHPYTICAYPFVNGKICGFLADAVDLQLAINRELVIYDWMKRLDTKGITFVPQSIIPDGMSYSQFAEQWTSMDGIVFYKPTQNGDKPFVEHGASGHLNTAEMVKMLSDTMADSVSASGALQGKTPYAGTSAQLYAQQKESSTTPIAVVSEKFDTFLKHLSIKKTKFIQKYYNVNQYAEIAGSMGNIDWGSIDLSKIGELKFKFKFTFDADHTSLRQDSNELLLSLMQQGMLMANDVLELGEFHNADAISAKLNERAAQMQAQQQIGADYEQKKQMFM